tara:strand:+ start:271 stop:1590 length:1320 start_codon:yes stop_codon:yes gene_type:complete
MVSRHIEGTFDIIIIGSGVSGLTCACILGKFGKKVLVLEQHDRPGGCLHTFQEKGFTFRSGNHYIGHIDPLCETLIKTCGSSFKEKDDIVEQYIWDGEHKFMHKNGWEDVMNAPESNVIAMADHMWWIALVKLAPTWLAVIAWCILNTVFPQSFMSYGLWMQDQGYSKWWKMQEGDVGCPPIAMVGAAVARHYMHGTSVLSDKFVHECCRTIRKQGGRVVINHTVQEIHEHGVVCNGKLVPCTKVISSIGASQTCKLAKLPKLNKACAIIGQGVQHHFVFVGLSCTKDTANIPGVTWIKEKDQYMFVSAEENRGKTSVHLVADEGSMTTENMVALFIKYFPDATAYVTHTEDATPYSVKKYLGRYSSYGLQCSKERFSKYAFVRALRPETEMPNLYLTGQDILMPGIVSAMTTAMMTCRQVLGFTLLDTILQKDLMDKL